MAVTARLRNQRHQRRLRTISPSWSPEALFLHLLVVVCSRRDPSILGARRCSLLVPGRIVHHAHVAYVHVGSWNDSGRCKPCIFTARLCKYSSGCAFFRTGNRFCCSPRMGSVPRLRDVQHSFVPSAMEQGWITGRYRARCARRDRLTLRRPQDSLTRTGLRFHPPAVSRSHHRLLLLVGSCTDQG